MKTCTHCGELKAESQMHRLGLDEVPVCKRCHRERTASPLERELAAHGALLRILDPLPADLRGSLLRTIQARYESLT